ncbi:DUF6207 family protein [Streptomyces massasporeus]
MSDGYRQGGAPRVRRAEAVPRTDCANCARQRRLPGAGRPRRRTTRPGGGEPGVRLRCYLDVRQELGSQP